MSEQRAMVVEIDGGRMWAVTPAGMSPAGANAVLLMAHEEADARAVAACLDGGPSSMEALARVERTLRRAESRSGAGPFEIDLDDHGWVLRAPHSPLTDGRWRAATLDGVIALAWEHMAERLRWAADAIAYEIEAREE